jgi:hypothetical protein
MIIVSILAFLKVWLGWATARDLAMYVRTAAA